MEGPLGAFVAQAINDGEASSRGEARINDPRDRTPLQHKSTTVVAGDTWKRGNYCC